MKIDEKEKTPPRTITKRCRVCNELPAEHEQLGCDSVTCIHCGKPWDDCACGRQ